MKSIIFSGTVTVSYVLLTDGHICWNGNCRLPFIVCWPRKTIFRFRMQWTNESLLFLFTICSIKRSCYFPLVQFFAEFRKHWDMEMETWKHGDIDMEFWPFTKKIKQKSEAQVIFLSPFTICSSCKQKFCQCPFGHKETNGSYRFADGLNKLGLNGLIGLAHLCFTDLLWPIHFPPLSIHLGPLFNCTVQWRLPPCLMLMRTERICRLVILPPPGLGGCPQSLGIIERDSLGGLGV